MATQQFCPWCETIIKGTDATREAFGELLHAGCYSILMAEEVLIARDLQTMREEAQALQRHQQAREEPLPF
jgi:hypothetical protein